MEVKWIPLNPKEISAKDLLEFRNRTLGIDPEPSLVEIAALNKQMDESSEKKGLYDLLAIKDGNIVGWANGMFSKERLVGSIRMFFFDADDLGEQGMDDLLYQLECSLPHPFGKIEIFGLGPYRERDLELVLSSGYKRAYDVSHYKWVKGAKAGPMAKVNMNYENQVVPQVGFEIYSSAFKQTWERDEVSSLELERIIASCDERLSFTTFQDEIPVGIVIVNKGLYEGDAYLQIIAASENVRGEGTGDAMMMNLMNQMMSHDIRSLSLATYADNEAMKKMLGRWHFVEQFRETVLFKDDFKKVDSK